MVTHLYETFGMKSPVATPDGGLLFQFVVVDDAGQETETHVFPMARESAEQFHKLLGEVLGKKVEVASLQDMQREVQNGVPPRAG